MKLIIIIKFCVALLLTIVPDGVRTGTLAEDLDKEVKGGGSVNGIFLPLDLLGSDKYGSTYKGQFTPFNNDLIAMKFTPNASTAIHEKEYRMYTYLGAIDSNVESFGIPSIHYYGTWSDYTMLGMTLIESTSPKICEAAAVEEKELLITFREFVKIMKFIHSQGILHRDATIQNMIIQDGQGFIFNFDQSRDMANRRSEGYISDIKYDFRCFLYSLFELPFTWQWFGFTNEDASQVKSVYSLSAAIRRVTNRNQRKTFTGLRRVFAEFGKHAVDNESTGIKDDNDNLIPFYDHLYQVIMDELSNYGEATSSHPSLLHISDPFGTNQWSRPPVDDEYFEKKYSRGKKNRGSCLCVK